MYLLDANVLIDAKNRYFAFDIVPAFWDWLAAQHSAGKVFIVQAVHDEIVSGGDELANWVKAQPASFSLAPTAADAASLTSVSAWANGSGFKAAAVSDFLQAADYFIVAQALTLGFAVVTLEKPDPLSKKRIKIPDACAAVGVTWITPFEMLRAEGAKFA
ncbi:DUF4411 family protein [Jatrophihabitans sp.]|uniref:DUF4411 family protein n=1 Tax=Jatrophihabitans sp. TaxID=1932789 RepID=UPI002B7668B4|nr:DUF4411 family protein [Jatrophihabitans sp.]